jgi:hypothetical protein
VAKQVLTPLEFANQATPANPSSGSVSLYAKGDSLYRLTSAGVETDLVPPSAPRGSLGYAEATTAQTGIGTAETSVIGMSVTVTVGASRRIKVTFQCLPVITSAVIDLLVTFRVKQDGLRVQSPMVTSHPNFYTALHSVAVVTPSAGSHTYTVTTLNSGGTHKIEAHVEYPTFLLVEDIGAA